MVANGSVNVYSIEGEVLKSVELPPTFRTAFRPDIIRKAVNAQRANSRQPYGPSETAGMRHAVSTWGKGRGVARVQRLTQGRMAAESPNNVGGRRAHPPRTEKDWSKKMNRKEKALARASALAALSDPERVRERGHVFDEDRTLPIVVENEFENLENTSSVMDALISLGVGDDVNRSKEGKKERAGRGKMRGRRYKMPTGVLIVVSREDAPIVKSAKNLAGVDVVLPDRLNAGVLAPGGDPGRLTVFSEAALEQLGGW